jgi:membrane associated rhomboid family serine protease
MLFLWIFGNNIEDRLGSVRYLGFYLLGGLAATVAHIVVQPFSTVPLIGASGAIAAVMGAYLVWFPDAPVRALLFFIFPTYIRAKWFLGFWFVMQFFTNAGSGVAWVAHVGGFVFGVLVALLVRKKPKAAEHLFRQPYRPHGGGPWDSSGGYGYGGGFRGRR